MLKFIGKPTFIMYLVGSVVSHFPLESFGTLGNVVWEPSDHLKQWCLFITYIILVSEESFHTTDKKVPL